MISLCFSYSTELPAVCSQAQLSRKTQLPPAESKPNTDDVLFLDVGWENSQVILLPYFTKCSRLLQDDSRSQNLRLARVDMVHKYHRFTMFYIYTQYDCGVFFYCSSACARLSRYPDVIAKILRHTIIYIYIHHECPFPIELMKEKDCTDSFFSTNTVPQTPPAAKRAMFWGAPLFDPQATYEEGEW